MILDSTKIAGDLKIAKGGHIYASGAVTIPPLAILEDSAVAPNETVIFSVEDGKPDALKTPGTIKTSGTVIANGTIIVPKESVVRAAAEFRISASKLTTTTVINAQ